MKTATHQYRKTDDVHIPFIPQNNKTKHNTTELVSFINELAHLIKFDIFMVRTQG